jgi:hypothetical protein
MKTAAQFFHAFLFAAACTITQRSYALDSALTFEFDRTLDYENVAAKPALPTSSSVVLHGNQLALGPNCIVKLRKEAYYPGGPFQVLLKSGESEVQISKFLNQKLSFKLSETKHFYHVDPPNECNRLGNDWLIDESRLIGIRAGSVFSVFKRSTLGAQPKHVAVDNASTQVGEAPLVDLQGLKVSKLPLRLQDFEASCLAKLPRAKGAWTSLWKTTNKCAPNVFPYLATRQSSDKLSQLIGTHAYYTNRVDRDHPEDYDNPVSHGLHPLFIVFPPMKDVILVRVADLEGGDEQRDTMSGAYLAIKSGKVIDQLNEGCDFNSSYECISEGKAKFRLLESGKFKELR